MLIFIRNCTEKANFLQKPYSVDNPILHVHQQASTTELIRTNSCVHYSYIFFSSIRKIIFNNFLILALGISDYQVIIEVKKLTMLYSADYLREIILLYEQIYSDTQFEI